ncbi:MAG: hypothetical protein HY861_01010 [Chlamydiia bacterium]|nr:hypothetical protein [Chlamydiia bacterium]
MLELASVRKNKVNLSDYGCEQDIANRMAIADFSAFDMEVLEEILFSTLKIPIKKLLRSLSCSEQALLSTLKNLSQAGLFSIQDDHILVDKEMRKYFEFQITRFSPDFKPDMEFLQDLLRKVPIHQLPIWYAVPRTSNNIFESIVEKYLLTPQIFQRHLADLSFGDPTIRGIVSDLFSAHDFTLLSSDVIVKYNLTRSRFEEILLLMEFNFIGCLSYQKEGDHWLEVITPFFEWHEYLRFLKATEPRPLPSSAVPQSKRPLPFAFVQDASALLIAMSKKQIALGAWHKESPLPVKIATELAIHCNLSTNTAESLAFAQEYLAQIFRKLCLVGLARASEKKIAQTSSAQEWLDKTLEERALYLYRHPANHPLASDLSPTIATERNIREAEKAIKRVLHGQWVLFDEFLTGTTVCLSADSVISLKRTGKHWKYTHPSYTEEEKSLLRAVVFEGLFEAGMVILGTCEGKDCFAVTPFGRLFFEDS